MLNFGKLNILDIAIISITVLLIFIGGIGYIINKNNEETHAVSNNVSTNFKYTIFIEALSDTSKDMFKVGDDVYDRVSNVCIGKITNIDITASQGLLDKPNGEIIRSPIPGKIDVELEIETNGSIKNGEYLANDLIRIMVGNLKQIKTKYVMCIGTVNSLNK